MKKYELIDLIKRGEREEMTVEQAVGQILLWLNTLSERVTKLETRVRQTRGSQSAEGS